MLSGVQSTRASRRGPAPARLTRDERKAATRIRLLEAAARVFAERGYHGASVDEIAEAAGFTIGALYAHFGSKQELFLALLREHVDRRMREYAAVLAREGSLEDRTRAAAESWMTFVQEHSDFFPLFMEYRALAARDPELRPGLLAALRTMRQSVAQLVTAGARESGIELTEDEARRLGAMINALGVGLALERGTDPAAVGTEVFGEALVLLMKGLAAERGRAGKRRT